VESPGTAPGSEPLITGAFIAIVRVAPHKEEYRRRGWAAQGEAYRVGTEYGVNDISGLGCLDSRSIRDWVAKEVVQVTFLVSGPLNRVEAAVAA
jgi:hypothetical protein